MHVVEEMVLLLAHHIAPVLGKKDCVIATGVTNVNDCDYYADLDIKIRYKLSF